MQKISPIGSACVTTEEGGGTFEDSVHVALRDFLGRSEYPCLGAKAALNSNSYQLHCYTELGNSAVAPTLATNLSDFLNSPLIRQSDFATFIAVFHGPIQLDEVGFEQKLWRTLSHLHAIDAPAFAWDPAVSSDPSSANFAFSFAGRGFYVIGLHPNSSRLARRFPFPSLVFNLHAQFEKLRADGIWDRMRTTIRRQDTDWQGVSNPMLSDFGETSEARQYSGRAVDKNWAAPFEAKPWPHRCPFDH